jgi:hypothetical protein
MKLIQYMDCRERDHARLRRAAAQIAGQLEGRRGEGVKG